MEGPSRTCTYIGPDQDPIRDFPIHYCGKPSIEGKSYCVHHYPMVYMMGSSVNRKRVNAKLIEDELAKLESEENEDELIG